MKIAYRIITPILAIGTIAMGIFLDMFYFAIGGASDQIDQLIPLLSMFNVNTKFSFSIYEIIGMLTEASSSAGGAEATEGAEGVASAFMSVAEPIMPHIIALIIFFVLALLVLLAISVVSAATEKRTAVLGLSCAGVVICFICVIIGKFAFDKIVGGEISIPDVLALFSSNEAADGSALTQLLTTIVSAVIKISSAAFSAGLYAVFGMYILIALWTVLTNMLVKTPIHVQKKHRRKKPLKSVSAVFRR